MKVKAVRGRPPLPVVVTVIGGLALAGIFFTEDLRALTGISILKHNNACCKVQDAITNTTQEKEKKRHRLQAEAVRPQKAAFDPNRCSVTKGQWVFDRSKKLPYTDQTCPYIEMQIACTRNGRPDTDYLYWEWQLDDCKFPRFDPRGALEKLRGKRLMFVGDSLQQGQWVSFVCLVSSVIPKDARSMRRSHSLSVFRAKQYNATIEFHWAPFLVQSNTDDHIIVDTSKRILHVDSIEKHARHWRGVDILVFDTYVWWMSGDRIKSVWGSFANGDEGFEELDAWIAYRLGLKTWANWIDSNINPNATRVFFTSISSTHMRSKDWHREDGIRCFNETRPVTQKGYWGSGSDRRMMAVVSSVLGKMKVPVTLLNITQLSEHRIDGHASVYTEAEGRLLTEEQKADPQQYADCIHWCVPGVPDTWNQVLYAYL